MGKRMTDAQLERKREALWIDDAELIRRMGVPEKIARETLRVLDAKRAFPAKHPLWGNRRYWPAVQAYFDRQYGVKVDAPKQRERA
jgi:hypothetical protein